MFQKKGGCYLLLISRKSDRQTKKHPGRQDRGLRSPGIRKIRFFEIECIVVKIIIEFDYPVTIMRISNNLFSYRKYFLFVR